MPTARRLISDLLRLLAERGDVRHLARGEVLFHEGDASKSMFILLTGKLKVYSRDERGREVTYNQLGPGEFLGEMLLDGGPRSASVKAMTAADCLEVPARKIRTFLRTYPEFSEVLVVKLIERLRHATTQVRSLALEGVYVRTVSLLRELAVSEDKIRYVPANVTQGEIASRIGATREMVNHVMRDLARGGFMVKDEQQRLLIKKALPRHW